MPPISSLPQFIVCGVGGRLVTLVFVGLGWNLISSDVCGIIKLQPLIERKLDIVMFLESNLECAGGGKETKTVDWRMKSSVCIWVFGRTLRRRFLWTPMSMALKQVMAEEDSEDEVDDDVANLEDQRMLDDFLDVTQDEKHMMQLWNSFIRKQRYFNSAYVL